MIGKIVTGKSFGGCVRYVVEKKDSTLLFAEGIRTENAVLMVRDFNIQRMANPALSKAVSHISLNWSEADKDKLTSEKMLEMAREYMEIMRIKDTQILIVQHRDNHHPHVHLIYNRVNNFGKTISDQFQFKKNVSACKVITLKHGLFLAADKSMVNRNALRGADKEKYAVYYQVNKMRSTSSTWKSFEQTLANADIELILKYRGQSSVVQGVSFKKGAYIFKGSELDRSMSFGKLDAHFQKNKSLNASKHRYLIRPKSSHYLDMVRQTSHLAHQDENLLDMLLRPGNSLKSESTIPFKKKKRKSRHQDQTSRLGR